MAQLFFRLSGTLKKTNSFVFMNSLVCLLPEKRPLFDWSVLSADTSGYIATNINFYLRPYLYLRLFPKPLEDHYVTAPFTVWLVAASTGAGTWEDPLLRGGLCEVQACLGDGPDTMMLNVISEQCSLRCVKIISLGEELTFSLYDYEAEHPVKLQLQLPNDEDFKRLYSEIRNAV